MADLPWRTMLVLDVGWLGVAFGWGLALGLFFGYMAWGRRK